MKHFAYSIDEFFECGFHEVKHEGPASHYARYDAETEEDAVNKAVEAWRPFIESLMYESDDYGNQI
jgi:hypothetical protein